MVRSIAIAIFALTSLTASWAQEMLEWKVFHPIKKTWLDLGTKGTVQEALIASGELPDPFVGENENKFTWIENHDWTFESSFTLNEADFLRAIDLDFPSIDTYASIFLNGKKIGETDNAFVHWYFDIRSAAKTGLNTLKLVFRSPVNYQKEHKKKVGVVLPSPNDVGKEKVAPYCRKPQYQFGWDWALRMNTIGFWEPVSILKFDKNRVTGTTTSTIEMNKHEAKQHFRVFFRHALNDVVFWESERFGVVKCQIINGEIQRTESIEDPKLWWPRGQGEQYLYTDKWLIRNEFGVILYQGEQVFGVRTTELVQEKDEFGTSFWLKINGRKVFCKGSDYIPDDVFPGRISEDKLRQNVAAMAACNFNMVRVWGGGFYPREVFLRACDEMGIMVWQDFMFACSMYPGNEEFIATIEPEMRQQIPRIAAHPSVVLFNGNNEVDVSWKNWGFQSTYKISASDQKTIERFYHRVFKEFIPAMVKEYSNIPYEHTSPLSNWGKEEFYNHGTQHYWGVWHGKDPIEDFGRKSGRFNAEYGFQSFPEFSTLKSFSDESEWRLDSPVMKHHQKSYVGNGMIAKHADLLYGKTSDFEFFVYLSQLTQAKAVSMAVVSHRVQFPRVTGSLFWQFNDCWPAPTWSSIDYFGNWKALQYAVRDDYRDLTVGAKIDTLGKEKYYLISDLPGGFGVKLRLEVYDFFGNKLNEYTCQRTLLGSESIELFSEEILKNRSQNRVFVFHWQTEQGTWSRTFVHETSNRTYSKQNLGIEVQYDAAKKSGELILKNKELMIDLWITTKKSGVHFDRNFETYLPGEHVIKFKSEGVLTEEDLMLFNR